MKLYDPKDTKAAPSNISTTRMLFWLVALIAIVYLAAFKSDQKTNAPKPPSKEAPAGTIQLVE